MWYTSWADVRKNNPHLPDDPSYGANWKRISVNDTERSWLKRYTIHVGPLTRNEQPSFQVERSVAESSGSDVKVGAPVPVAGGDDGDTLTYRLSGKGSSHFSVVGTPGGAQVTVAYGAVLDYKTKPTYDLVLEVSDGKDRLNNNDRSVDNAVALKIELETAPSVSISATSLTPKVGEAVTFTATTSNLPVGQGGVTYTWAVLETNNTWTTIGRNSDTFTSTYDSAGTRGHKVIASWGTSNDRTRIESELLRVTWSN